jgi:type IV pilus assembly protein PilC
MAIFDWHRQARLCESLGSTLDAGLPPHVALGLAADAAGGAVGRRARAAAAAVSTGTPLSTALAASGEDVLLCAVLAAGERSGRLPPLARQLAATFALRARLRDEIIGRLIYPVVLIHVALILLPLPWVVSGALPAWAMLAGPLAVWTLVLGGWLSVRASHRAGLLARLALRHPFRLLCRPALVADAAAVLGAALSAGLLVPDALELAAGACANRELAARLREAAAAVRTARLPDLTAALAACGLEGDELELIRTGERSGKLEEGLGQARSVAAERFALRLQWTARLTTGTVYGLAMVIAVVSILAMAAQIYGPLLRELDGQ